MALTVYVTADDYSRFHVVQVRGEVDVATVGELERSIQAIDPAGRSMVIDLSATDFMDSSGLRLLAATQEQLAAAGCSLRLVLVEGAVKRVLEVTDLLGDFEVYPTVSDATS